MRIFEYWKGKWLMNTLLNERRNAVIWLIIFMVLCCGESPVFFYCLYRYDWSGAALFGMMWGAAGWSAEVYRRRYYKLTDMMIERNQKEIDRLTRKRI